MKTNTLFLNILTLICHCEASQISINKLVELTHKYALAYLRYYYKNQYKVLLSEDVTLNELAIDDFPTISKR